MSRIQNNIMALNTHRMYNKNNNNIQKSSEKLSSGYRINRAGDDAAGLAISEKMRAQIRGLNMASKNSNDAISLVQTAEGALQEVHTMLQRMNELAVQSASDTNVTIDRNALQLEFENLQEEIDQIAQTTKFNDTMLLDGSMNKGGAAGAKGTGNFDFVLGDAAKANNALGYVAPVASESEIQFGAAGQGTAVGGKISAVVAYKDANGNSQSLTVELDITAVGEVTGADGTTKYSVIDETQLSVQELADILAAELNKTALADQFTIVSDNADTVTMTAKTAGTAGGSVTGIMVSGHDLTNGTTATGSVTTPAADAYDTLNLANLSAAGGSNAWDGTADTLADATFSVDGKKYVIAANTVTDAQIAALGSDYTVIKSTDATAANAGAAAATQLSNDLGITVENTNGTLSFKPNAATTGTAGKGGIVIQVGAEEGHTLDLSIDAMNTQGLGITKAQANIATRDAAQKAITVSRNAINTVSTQRAKLGAMQNRLEYKISNLDITAENLQAAESRIRDVDMAKEMTNFTKNNILTQAATAMLAQANAAPQNVLQLLG